MKKLALLLIVLLAIKSGDCGKKAKHKNPKKNEPENTCRTEAEVKADACRDELLAQETQTEAVVNARAEAKKAKKAKKVKEADKAKQVKKAEATAKAKATEKAKKEAKKEAAAKAKKEKEKKDAETLRKAKIVLIQEIKKGTPPDNDLIVKTIYEYYKPTTFTTFDEVNLAIVDVQQGIESFKSGIQQVMTVLDAYIEKQKTCRPEKDHLSLPSCECGTMHCGSVDFNCGDTIPEKYPSGLGGTGKPITVTMRRSAGGLNHDQFLDLVVHTVLTIKQEDATEYFARRSTSVTKKHKHDGYSLNWNFKQTQRVVPFKSHFYVQYSY